MIQKHTFLLPSACPSRPPVSSPATNPPAQRPEHIPEHKQCPPHRWDEQAKNYVCPNKAGDRSLGVLCYRREEVEDEDEACADDDGPNGSECQDKVLVITV